MKSWNMTITKELYKVDPLLIEEAKGLEWETVVLHRLCDDKIYADAAKLIGDKPLEVKVNRAKKDKADYT